MMASMKLVTRSAAAARIMLTCMLASGVGLGAYTLALPNDAPNNNAQTPRTSGSPADTSPTVEAVSFTTADTGACLTWEETEGKVTGFEQTDCAAEHRFEVSSREDLSTYPAAEFGPDAKLPDLTRQAQLREELCYSPTVQYLGGRFDPLGKYSVAPILPPQEAWDQGDRTLLCGVQATDQEGRVISTTGKAAEQDQARVFPAGTCISLDPAGGIHTVDCADPHQLEITKIVNLEPVFRDRVPTVEDQDRHLRTECTDAAREYLGNDDKLYESTLQPFWSTITDNSWNGGTRSVNCALVFGQDGRFASLKGTAKAAFTINDQPPAPRPKRSPIVNPDALAQVP